MLYFIFMLVLAFVRIIQHEVLPPISAANSLPTAFWCAQIRCRETHETASKPLISGDYSPQRRRFSGAKPGFPCCQGISAGFALAREARSSPTGGATRAATPRAAAAAAYRARGRTGYGRRRCHR